MSFFRTYGFDAAVIGLVTVLSIVAIAWLMLAPPSGMSPVAVLFPPWMPLPQAMFEAAEAGGEIIGSGGLSSIVFVAPDHADYARAAKARGAWLIVDAALAGNCNAVQKY